MKINNQRDKQKWSKYCSNHPDVYFVLNESSNVEIRTGFSQRVVANYSRIRTYGAVEVPELEWIIEAEQWFMSRLIPKSELRTVPWAICKDQVRSDCGKWMKKRKAYNKREVVWGRKGERTRWKSEWCVRLEIREWEIEIKEEENGEAGKENGRTAIGDSISKSWRSQRDGEQAQSDRSGVLLERRRERQRGREVEEAEMS